MFRIRRQRSVYPAALLLLVIALLPATAATAARSYNYTSTVRSTVLRYASTSVSASSTQTVTVDVSGYTATAKATASRSGWASAHAYGTGYARVTVTASSRSRAKSRARAYAKHAAHSRAATHARSRAYARAHDSAYALAHRRAVAAARATATAIARTLAEARFSAAAKPAPPADPTAPCGGEAPVKADGTSWICTFDDEFAGTSLDTSKWTVQTTAASGFHSGIECFVDDPGNVAVSNGTLKLTARRAAAPFTCPTPSGGYATQYTSGTVNGFSKFAQTYGRFEVRAKLPATTVKGLQETLWLWPVNSWKYGLWPASGEIDFAEFYSKYAGWNIPYLHYTLLQSTVNWSTNANVYTALPGASAQPGMTCSYDTSTFNTYTVLWEPGRITLRVNGKNCIVDNYSASNVSGAAPFDQPFFLALTQALGIGDNAFVAGTTPLPATTEVDYVRIWK
jgi:beta-glucanase (GH16 family)